MAIKFFGHYLTDEGKLSEAQLAEAIEYQNKNNLSLGQLAVREGLITTAEAEKINDKQRSQDMRFGEVALSLDLLTDPQIGELLTTQKKEKIFFGEVLVLKRFMTEEKLQAELKAFESEQNIEVTELQDKISELDKNNLIKDSIGVLQTLYSRIVLDHIKLIQVSKSDTTPRSGIISSQAMHGDLDLEFVIQADDAVSLAVSSKYLKMDFDAIDEMVVDIMSEFVNVVLGNIAVKLSVGNVTLDLKPPLTIESSKFNHAQYYCFDFITTQGNLTLYLKL